MPRLLLVLLLLLPAPLSSAAAADERRDRRIPDLHRRLAQWCAADENCRIDYHMEEPRHATSEAAVQRFSLLASVWLPEEHLSDDEEFVRRHFEVPHNRSETRRLRWLLLLRLARASNFAVRCNVNERLVVDPHTLDGSCECDENRQCDDPRGWYTPLNLASTAINAAVALVIIEMVLMIIADTRRLLSPVVPVVVPVPVPTAVPVPVPVAR
jgi:hypothetical protein